MFETMQPDIYIAKTGINLGTPLRKYTYTAKLVYISVLMYTYYLCRTPFFAIYEVARRDLCAMLILLIGGPRRRISKNTPEIKNRATS